MRFANHSRRKRPAALITVVAGPLAPLLFLTGAASCAAQQMARVNPRQDVVCGPRCVQYVLQAYGHDEELMPLVDEIQRPQVERGTSLDDLATALRQRGIQTAAVRLSEDASLRWPHPVIVHLKGDATAGGHFVVWLPSSRGNVVQVWNGLFGVETYSARRFALLRSGPALLTARERIRNPERAAARMRRPLASYLLGGGLVTATLFAGLIMTRRRGRHRTFNPVTDENEKEQER